MNKCWKYFILTGILGLLSFISPGKRIDKEVKDVFARDEVSYTEIKVSEELNSQTPSNFTEDNFFRVLSGGEFLGFAYIDKAPSKTAEFDYLVILDKNLKILRTRVLVYREEYGGEIGSRRWLKQFIGKSPDDNLEDVAAISGATISVRSMKRAVGNILASLEILRNKDAL